VPRQHARATQHRCWSTPQGRGPKRAPSSLLVSVALRELGQWLWAEYSAADQPVSERPRAPEGDARLGAALAYYSVFSLGALIVIAVAIAGLLFRHDAVRGCKLLLHERSEERSSNVKASH
jgi:hypothetical protein